MQQMRKEIEDFMIVCKYLNFSKAADFLGVKQSGLSKSINRLEKDLGHKLFIRQARGLFLTKAAEIYHCKVLEMRNVWNQAENDIDSLFNTISGNFQIAVHPIIGKYIVPKIVNKIDHIKELKINFDFVTSREATKKVLSSEVDLAIVAYPILYPELIIKRLWREYIGLYSRDGKMKNKLIINSHMINSYKNLNLINHDFNYQVIDDYDVLYSIIKDSKTIMGLLPNPIGEQGKKLKLVKKFPPNFDVVLAYRNDKLKTKGLKFLIESIIHCGN